MVTIQAGIGERRGRTRTPRTPTLFALASFVIVAILIASPENSGAASVGYFESHTQVIDAGHGLDAVTCVESATSCVVGDDQGKLFYTVGASTTADATWTPWAGPGPAPVDAIACPSTALCLVAAGDVGDGGGDVYRSSSLGGGFLTSFTPRNGVETISCPSTAFCVAAQAGEGDIRYSTKPSAVSWIPETIGTGAMTGVSCLSSSFCAVVDDSGHLRVATSEAKIKEAGGIGWTATDIDGSLPLRAVACISTSRCLAVDGSGDVIELAVGSEGEASGTRLAIPGAGGLTDIACDGGSCAAGDEGGAVFGSGDGGSTWTVRGGAGAVEDVSCASASLCAASTASGAVTTFDPTVTVPPLLVTTTSLPTGRAGSAYGPVSVGAEGGAGPYTWSASGLAPGLSIDPSSGQISGTPITAVCATSPCPQPPMTYTPTITVTDANGTVASDELSLPVSGTDVGLEISTIGDGSGSVSSSPGGIDRCGAPGGSCQASFEDATTVTLTPSPGSGSTFAGWTGGGCSGTGPCVTSLTGDTRVTARFDKKVSAPTLRTLTVDLNGGGLGSVTDAGGAISCPGSCAHGFADGTRVTLTALPGKGSRFTGWSGGGCSGTDTCEVALGADQTVTANFSKTPPQTRILKARISKDGTASFRFGARGGNRFQCALARAGGGLKFSGCRSPRAYRHLTVGRYVFEVRALGPGGTDPTAARRSFRIHR
jgi:Divergent InlB B-repeat domain/Putative Ig domain